MDASAIIANGTEADVAAAALPGTAIDSEAVRRAWLRDLPTRYGVVAPTLLDHGWAPVPLHLATKIPTRREWQHRATMAAADLRGLVLRELAWRGDAACGVVVPATIVAIDNDLMDRSSNDCVWRIMCETLGPPPVVRVGAAPKSLTVYGIAQPIASRRLGGIDIFCGSGQIAAFGMHAKTGRPYAWSVCNPLNMRPTELPRVSAEAVERFIARVVAAGVLVRAGGAQPRRANTDHVNSACMAAGSAASRVPYPATVRLNSLLGRHDGRVKPAVRELIEEIGVEGCGRHDAVVAVVGRLVQLRWAREQVHEFLTPLVNDAFLEGDWSREVEDALRHARDRQAARLGAEGAGTAQSARLARIFTGAAP
jgi:hypothetical protein